MTTIRQQMESRRPLALRELGFWNWLLKRVAATRITPNQVSVAGMVFGLASGAALALTPALQDGGMPQRLLLLAAILLMILRGACNIFDGVLAVETGRASRVGLLFNEVPDRISDIGILVGAGFAIGSHPLLGLSAALGALLTAYVRVQCHLAGASADFSGPMAKPARMVIVGLAFGVLVFIPLEWWPAGSGGLGLGAAALAIITIGTVITSVIRLRHAAIELESKHDDVLH